MGPEPLIIRLADINSSSRALGSIDPRALYFGPGMQDDAARDETEAQTPDILK